MAQTTDVRRAIDHARHLISTFQQTPGPVDIVRLAYQQGIEAVEPADMNADGYLGRRPDGTLVIRYRATNSPNRNRFTIAHEIAHLILARAQGQQIENPGKGYERDPQEETAVNRVAAELLMPARFVLDQLYKCERGRELPSWRTINALCRTYQVSPSAMAFRMLELPNLLAISMRISIDGHAPQFPFDRSENRVIRLVNGVEFEMERLWRDARKSTRHAVSIRFGGVTLDVPCDGIVKSMTTRLGPARHYWAIGWLTNADGVVSSMKQRETCNLK